MKNKLRDYRERQKQRILTNQANNSLVSNCGGAGGTMGPCPAGGEGKKDGAPEIQFGEHHKSTADDLRADKWSNHGPTAKVTLKEARDAVFDQHHEELQQAAYAHHGIKDPDKATEKEHDKAQQTVTKMGNALAKKIHEAANA